MGETQHNTPYSQAEENVAHNGDTSAVAVGGLTLLGRDREVFNIDIHLAQAFGRSQE